MKGIWSRGGPLRYFAKMSGWVGEEVKVGVKREFGIISKILYRKFDIIFDKNLKNNLGPIILSQIKSLSTLASPSQQSS